MFEEFERSSEELGILYKSLLPKTGESCVYCGFFATDKEHVVPISWIKSMHEMKQMGFNVIVPEEVIVPSCHECNGIASDKLFVNFSDKRKFIALQLLRKYKKYLNYKEWTLEEIEETSGRLKEHVFFHNEIGKAMKRRLKRVSKYIK